MLRVRMLVGVVVPFWLFACAHPQTSSQTPVNADVISEEEIAATNASNAYEVIKRLRANFLSFRGKTSLLGTSNADPTVYVDDQAYGPIASLKTIPVAQITSIRMYRSWEATTKFGQGNMGGVIAISTKQ